MHIPLLLLATAFTHSIRASNTPNPIAYDAYFTKPRIGNAGGTSTSAVAQIGQTITLQDADISTQWKLKKRVYSDPSFTEVFYATEVGDGGQGRIAAIKIILKSSADSPTWEPDLFHTLPRHPNILEYLGKAIIQGNQAMGTRFAEYGTLHEYIVDYYPRRTKVDPSIVKSLFHDVLSGLAHLNAHGYVHDDLYPRNVFLASTGTPGYATAKLGDFEFTHRRSQRSWCRLSLTDEQGLCVMLIQLSLTLVPMKKPTLEDYEAISERIPEIRNSQQRDLAVKICHEEWNAEQALGHQWFS